METNYSIFVIPNSDQEKRAFRIFKSQFMMLDSKSFYPFMTQVDLVLALGKEEGQDPYCYKQMFLVRRKFYEKPITLGE